MRLNEIIKLLETNEYHNIQQAIGALEAMKPKTGQHELVIYLDAGDLGELECEVSFDYQPAIKEYFEHPGEPENYDIMSVVSMGIDITDLVPYKVVVSAIKYERVK